VENAQPDVPAPQREALAHHVDDAIGQAVVFAKAVAAIALDVDDASGIAVGIGEILADEGKIDLHALTPLNCGHEFLDRILGFCARSTPPGRGHGERPRAVARRGEPAGAPTRGE